MPNHTYRCPACKAECLEGDIQHEDGLPISLCCDEIVERGVWLCETCGEREQHKGCDICFECLLDESIADPRTIEQCAPQLQAEIAKGLAERLRPWLRTKQAA